MNRAQRPQTTRTTALMLWILSSSLASCEACFIDATGGEGQRCARDERCQGNLHCVQGICISPCDLCAAGQVCIDDQCIWPLLDSSVDDRWATTDGDPGPDSCRSGCDAGPSCTPGALRCSSLGDVERCDDSGDGWVLERDCPSEEGSCLEGTCVCSPRHHLGCSSGDIFWFDSCGEREEVAEDCGELVCDGVQCVPAVSCPPDALRCSAGGNVERCNGDGNGWDLVESCGQDRHTCVDGACVCTPHHHQDCFGGDTWWFDGCDVREELAMDCPDDRELCVNAACACIPRHHRACYERDVWWFDGCDNREELAEDCVAQSRSCVADICACIPGDHLGCDDDQLVWFDSCGQPGAAEETPPACASGLAGVCAAGQQDCLAGELRCVANDQEAGDPIPAPSVQIGAAAGGAVCSDMVFMDLMVSQIDGYSVYLSRPADEGGSPLLLDGRPEVACLYLDFLYPRTIASVEVFARSVDSACDAAPGGPAVEAEVFGGTALEGTTMTYVGACSADQEFEPADRFRVHPPRFWRYIALCRPAASAGSSDLAIDAVKVGVFGPETCDGRDEDCDGVEDEGVHLSREDECLEDGTLGSWQTLTTALPYPWYGFNAFMHDGYLYALGGRNSYSTHLDSVYRVRINGDGTLGSSWTPLDPLPGPRQQQMVIYQHGGKKWVMLLGGYVPAVPGPGSEVTRDVLVAELEAGGSLGSWQATASLPRRLRNFRAAYHRGHIYALSGYDGDEASITPIVTVGELDSSGSGILNWTENETPDNTYAQADAQALAHNDRLYMIGGSDAEHLGSTERSVTIAADGTLGASWVDHPPVLADWSRRAQLIFTGDWLFLMGGTKHNQETGLYYQRVDSTSIMPDGSLGAWRTFGYTSFHDRHPQYVLGNGYIYALGGRSPDGATTYQEIRRITY